MMTPRCFRFTPLLAVCCFAFHPRATALQRVSDPVLSRDRMVVTTAEVTLEVRSCREAISEGERIAVHQGGSLTASDITSGRNRSTSGSIVLKVPSNVLDEALAELRLRARRVEREVILRNDLAEQLADVVARIGSKQLVEQRYAQVLHSAKVATEILSVEEELTKVREDIDRLTAQQRDLSNRARFSTITVTFHEPPQPCRCRRR